MCLFRTKRKGTPLFFCGPNDDDDGIFLKKKKQKKKRREEKEESGFGIIVVKIICVFFWFFFVVVVEEEERVWGIFLIEMRVHHTFHQNHSFLFFYFFLSSFLETHLTSTSSHSQFVLLISLLICD